MELILLSCISGRSAECKRGAQQFESLNAEYGINKKVLFMRVNTDLIPVSTLIILRNWNMKQLKFVFEVKNYDSTKLKLII